MKKRNLLVLVCIMLVAVLTLVSCGGKDNPEPEHEHTYNTSVYVSDATHHWYGASCEHTDVKLQVEAHADANKDGVCDKCEYVTCTHEYADEWTSDETDHWHAASCGCDVIADKAAHADTNKDGKCDVCEYVTCTHTFAEEYSSDENGHWLAYTCGCELEPTVDAHVDENKDGICDVCDYVTCTHNPESAWTSDVFSHWHATDCGCLVKIDEAAHEDENADGACDVCSYVCDHPASEEWSSDDTNHWHDAVCDHEVDPTDVEAHYDLNKDGKCDVCAYEDPTHEHTWELAYNAAQHYRLSNCGHMIVKDFENHVDADENGACDTCNAYVAGLAEIVDSSTSDEAAAKVNASATSKATGTDSDPWIDTESVEFTKNYTILHGSYSDAYLSTYTGTDGQPALFHITPYEDGSAYVNSYATDLALMKGSELSLLYSYDAIGTEAFVYGLYDYAQQNAVYAYTEGYDAATGVYSFSYAVELINWDDSVSLRTISVEVTLVDGTIFKVVATGLEYDGNTFVLDKDNNVYLIIDDAPTSKQVVTVDQTIGDRSDAENPYKAEDYLIFDLAIYNDATGTEIKDGDVIEISVGKDNALAVVLSEADAAKAEYNGLVIDNNGNWSVIGNTYSYPYLIYTTNAVGEFPITFSSTAGGSVSFTLKVNYIAPGSLSAAVVDGENKTEADSVETYVGVPVTIGAIADSSAGSPHTTAEVTTGDPDVVTLTADGENWIVSASETGTYTITLTSTLASSVKTSISLVVVDAPLPEELLKGNYELSSMSGEEMTVKFTPDYEGALTGTVVVAYNDGWYYNPLVISETATYSFAAGVISLSHVEGDGVEQISLSISDTYEIVLSVYPDPVYSPDYYIEYTLEKGEDDPVVVEPNGTQDAPYVLTESTTITVDLAAGEKVYYTFTPTADGTVSFNVLNDFADFSVAWGTYNFKLLDNSLFQPTATFSVTKDVTVYIAIDTYSGDAGAYSVEFTYEGEAAEAPTLDSIAGTWEGTESGSMIYQGESFDITLNINADGTGTGSHSECGDFNITSVTVDGMNVTIVTDCEGTTNKTLKLVLADGKLTLASGSGMMYGNTIELTQTSTAGGSEGGESGEAPATPTLEYLAGTWKGNEAGGLMALEITLTLNADGTGTLLYNDGWDHNCTVKGVVIDGNSITITYNTGRTDQTLSCTYENGTITCASGIYAGAFTLTKQGGTDGDEGGDATGPALEDLAGTWTGSEESYGTVNYNVTVNADGTGSGSYTSGVGPGAFTTTFDITAIVIDGNTVTFSTITTGEYGGTEDDIVFTYADGSLSTDKGLMWGPLTLTPGSGDSGNTDAPVGTATVGGASYDYATVLELADANYVTTIGAGEKVYFAFEHDYASMTAIYEITFVVTTGDCTLYSVTYTMAGETATALPANYCVSSIDLNNWKAVVAIENTTDAEITYGIEVTYATVQA